MSTEIATLSVGMKELLAFAIKTHIYPDTFSHLLSSQDEHHDYSKKTPEEMIQEYRLKTGL